MIILILLSLLILLHEFGHFLAAKKFGVKVEEFGIGLPPKLVSLGKRGGTEYTLNWLPFGGFVKVLGEDGELTIAEKLNPLLRKQSFSEKPGWQRAIILLAGIIMNFLIGVLLFSVVYSISGVPKYEGEEVVITQVAPGSPAEGAGIKEGDVVMTIEGVNVQTSEAFVKLINEKKGQVVSLSLVEMLADGTLGSDRREVEVTPRVQPPDGEGALGVGIVTLPNTHFERKPWYLAPFYGAVEGVKEAGLWSKEILRGLVTLGKNLVQGKVPKGISGPVGIWKMGEKIQQEQGFVASLRFGAILAINLAIFNLLPLPALDGGRLVFIGVEKVWGKKWVRKYEKYVHFAGLILLVLLLVAVTWNDIRNW
ncbi:MAG: M50 family metallopeptidase [bacterium]